MTQAVNRPESDTTKQPSHMAMIAMVAVLVAALVGGLVAMTVVL